MSKLAARTGTQLKSDLAAIESALATAVTTPTSANLAAVVTACNTVESNSRDSRGVLATATQAQVAASFAGLARNIRRNVQGLLQTGHGITAQVSAAETRKQLRRIQKSVTAANGQFQALKVVETVT